MSELFHRQIMGTEMEWNVGVRAVGKTEFVSLDRSEGRWDSGQITTILLPPDMQEVNKFLSNGARFYMDVGTHPEYSTPENISPKDLLVSERAGERVVADVLHRFLLQNELVDEVVLMKRVVDANGESTGYHLNMSEDRKRINAIEDIHPLAMHYAVSLPLLGGGAVERRQRKNAEEGVYDYRYSWGQKVIEIYRDFSTSTTREKPFINTRNEPHAKESDYWRFHIVGVDPHILDEPAWMLFGTTSLMLAAVRQKRLRRIELTNGALSPGAQSPAHRRRPKSDRKDSRTGKGAKKLDYSI
jgi:proteasome accessory factor A